MLSTSAKLDFGFLPLLTLDFYHAILWIISKSDFGFFQGGLIMIERTAKDALIRLASQFPVIGVTGPRQSGKSTLTQATFPDKRYVTFDDKNMRELAASNPSDFIMAFPNGAIIDEAQKVPEIFRRYLGKRNEKEGFYSGKSNSWWWLRSNGKDRMHAAYVNENGEISTHGYGVISNRGAVRPVIRLSRNSSAD